MTSLAYYFSGRNRKKKWDFFMGEFRPGPGDKVLDIGFNEREYSATDNYIEKFYPYPENLTAIGVDEPVTIADRYPQSTFLAYDGKTMPFEDKAFDIVWSNAVVEHVGDYDAQAGFVRELARVSKSFFFTTPNLYFPMEVHTRTPFLHWLGKRPFDRYLCRVGKRWAAGDYMHLLSCGRLRSLLEDAEVTDYTIVRNRLCGFVLDFWVYCAKNR